MGVALLYLGDLGADNFLMRSSLIVVLGGLVLFHLGLPIFKAVLFPLAFLFFMVPLPGVIFYAITFPLQQLAAQQAAWTLETLGVPVLLDGNIIHLAQLSLGVTEACSGIRSLISLVAGAVAWAYLLLPRGWAMILFVAATLPITIVANAARVVLTGLIGQYIGVEYASGLLPRVRWPGDLRGRLRLPARNAEPDQHGRAPAGPRAGHEIPCPPRRVVGRPPGRRAPRPVPLGG